MRVRRVPVGDVALEIAEAGEGGRPFLLVHGFTGAKEDFSPFLDDLAALGWHAVAPDLRGHGGSDQPSGPCVLTLASAPEQPGVAAAGATARLRRRQRRIEITGRARSSCRPSAFESSRGRSCPGATT